MRIRKAAAFLMVLPLCAALFTACATSSVETEIGSPRETPSSEEPEVMTLVEEPTPTPEPEPVVFLYGTEDAFFPAVCENFLRDSVQTEYISTLAEAAAYPGKKVLIYYSLTEAVNTDFYAEAGNIQVISVTPDTVEETASNGVTAVSVRMESGAAEALLEFAIAYPPHDTPVRMLGIFSSKESAAYAAWESFVSAGKIFAKKEFDTASTDSTCALWMEARLKAYYPGMLDCLFTETAEDALTVAETLQNASRTDMEIFCGEYSEEVYALMLQYPELIAGILHTDTEQALETAARNALQSLAGEAVPDTLIPATVLSKSPALS